MQRLLIVIIFVFLFTSCDFFSSKKTTDQNMSMAIDTIIDYSTVDIYPMFLNCEGLESKRSQEECFGNELVNQLDKLILLKGTKLPNVAFDTVFVDLLVAKNNRIKVLEIKSSEFIKAKIPNLDSVLMASINQLESVTQLAIKRGIPVRSQYKLPILINVKD